MICDQAEEDAEIVGDPFLEAGIKIPSDLPYQPNLSENTGKVESKEEKRHSTSNMKEKQELLPLDATDGTSSN